MAFETLEEARNYYEEYGRQKGFWIRIRTSVKRRWGSNDVTGVLFVCSHQGKYVGKTKKDDAMDENSGKENEKKPKADYA